jgi:hypothetical protein
MARWFVGGKAVKKTPTVKRGKIGREMVGDRDAEAPTEKPAEKQIYSEAQGKYISESEFAKANPWYKSTTDLPSGTKVKEAGKVTTKQTRGTYETVTVEKAEPAKVTPLPPPIKTKLPPGFVAPVGKQISEPVTVTTKPILTIERFEEPTGLAGVAYKIERERERLIQREAPGIWRETKQFGLGLATIPVSVGLLVTQPVPTIKATAKSIIDWRTTGAEIGRVLKESPGFVFGAAAGWFAISKVPFKIKPRIKGEVRIGAITEKPTLVPKPPAARATTIGRLKADVKVPLRKPTPTTGAFVEKTIVGRKPGIYRVPKAGAPKPMEIKGAVPLTEEQLLISAARKPEAFISYKAPRAKVEVGYPYTAISRVEFAERVSPTIETRGLIVKKPAEVIFGRRAPRRIYIKPAGLVYGAGKYLITKPKPLAITTTGAFVRIAKEKGYGFYMIGGKVRMAKVAQQYKGIQIQTPKKFWEYFKPKGILAKRPKIKRKPTEYPFAWLGKPKEIKEPKLPKPPKPPKLKKVKIKRIVPSVLPSVREFVAMAEEPYYITPLKPFPTTRPIPTLLTPTKYEVKVRQVPTELQQPRIIPREKLKMRQILRPKEKAKERYGFRQPIAPRIAIKEKLALAVVPKQAITLRQALKQKLILAPKPTPTKPPVFAFPVRPFVPIVPPTKAMPAFGRYRLTEQIIPRKYRYTPSIVGMEFKIPEPKIKEVYTGLEVRGIPIKKRKKRKR